MFHCSASDTDTLYRHYIRKVISDVMEENNIAVERRLWEIQFTFIRQLQRDREEIRMRLDEAGERAELEKELEMNRE